MTFTSFTQVSLGEETTVPGTILRVPGAKQSLIHGDLSYYGYDILAWSIKLSAACVPILNISPSPVACRKKTSIS